MFARLAPFLFVLIWSTGWAAAGYAVPFVDPLTFLAIRFGLAAILIGSVCAAAGARFPATTAEWAHALVNGVLGQGLYLAGVWWAIKHGVPAGISGLIAATQPLLTALLSNRLAGEPLRAAQWLGVGLGFAGVALVLAPKFSGTDLAGAAFWPVIVNIGGMAAVTLSAFYQKRFLAGSDTRSLTALQAAGGFLVVLPLAFLLEARTIEWRFETIAVLAWAVLGLSFAGSSLLLYMIRKGAVARVAALIYLMPPLAAAQSWLLLGERLSAIQLAGFAIVTLGVWLAAREPVQP
jgi:drug/metabolite transporter (DMT)-like permease